MTDQNFPEVASPDEEEALLAEQRRIRAVRALRRFVSRHNWHALTLAMFALAAAVILWGATYLFVYWFTLVTVTVSRSFDPNTILEINDLGLISSQFPWWFLGGAILALFIAWLVHDWVRTESLREARHYLLWVTVELFIAIPNVTFSVWGNLSALVRLRRSEAANAWRLLERVSQEGGKLSMASLRLEIEDERQLQHVVFVLQIVGLVDLRERKEGWFLCLNDPDACALLSKAAIID